MVYVASEMEREGFTLPLLIGGATTSKVHTAVKIAPAYSKTTVYVQDASRAVGVAGQLMSQETREGYAAKVRADYTKVREAHARQSQTKRRQTIENSRANRTAIAWDGYVPERPRNLGLTIFDDYDLAELTRTIDWTPFFQTWELAGQYPAILDDAVVGKSARSLFNDAQAMLQRLIGDKWLTAKAVIGFWPANSVGDDIEIYTDESRTRVLTTIHTLRQQMFRDEGARANAALADFIAPKDSGIADYIGAFAVTAGIGVDERAAIFERDHDDYNSILVKALADRLAEILRRTHASAGAARALGLCRPAETLSQRRSHCRKISRHPSGAGLSRLPRPHREGDAMETAGRGEQRRHSVDREFRHVAGGFGQRLLFRPSRHGLFRRRQDRARPGGRLRAAQRHDRHRGGALARAQSQLRSTRFQ